jgi:hypothetical protein
MLHQTKLVFEADIGISMAVESIGGKILIILQPWVSGHCAVRLLVLETLRDNFLLP